MVRDGILAALLFLVAWANYEADVIRPFVHQYANAVTCFARNLDTEDLRPLRSALKQNVASSTVPGDCRQG